MSFKIASWKAPGSILDGLGLDLGTSRNDFVASRFDFRASKLTFSGKTRVPQVSTRNLVWEGLGPHLGRVWNLFEFSMSAPRRCLAKRLNARGSSSPQRDKMFS